MNKQKRNFWLDVILLALFGLNVVSLAGGHHSDHQAIHHATGMLMIAGVALHLIWHWGWIKANLLRQPGQAGHANHRVSILLIALFALCGGSGLMLQLAEFTPMAHPLVLIGGWNHLHSLSGMLLLVLIAAHVVHHAKWLVGVARKCLAPGGSAASKAITPPPA